MIPSAVLPPETVLIVDDEEPIRRTFREWLESAHLGITLLTAGDAETALLLANENVIDLAILDWNLGAGNDGLQLLDDLYEFNSSLVAIMITGYAHQATPLDAMRKGVRDYLDKNQDLNRTTFLRAVQRQLDVIRPARRDKRLTQGLVAFRAAVEKVLPLVQASAALNDPVSLPEVIRSLFRFLLQVTQAKDGVLFARSYQAQRQPPELCRVFDRDGAEIQATLVPFSTSLASLVIGMGEPGTMNRPADAGVTLQPFERDRQSILAVPLRAAAGLQVVVELFDRDGGFGDAERAVATTAAELGSQLLLQELNQRQAEQVLYSAVMAALQTSENVQADLQGAIEMPTERVMEPLRQGWGGDNALMLKLAEAIRTLEKHHGAAAVVHCLRLIESLQTLLDNVTGLEEVGS